jgi:tetrathionate reductase subunit B
MGKLVEKKLSRRQLLKVGALGAASLVAVKATQKAKAASQVLAGKRYAMAVDLRRCTGCHACSVACKSEFGVPLGVFRSWVKIKEKGKYPNVKKFFLPRLCNQCDDPPCVPVCPVQATYIGEDGIVLIDPRKCIGCGACITACPYLARFRNPVSKTAEKCDFCLHRIENGVVPACVNACPADARIFGDLHDSEGEVSKIVAKNATQVLKPELGTKPQVFYISADGFTGLGGENNA